MTIVHIAHLKDGHTTSCGCRKAERAIKRRTAMPVNASMDTRSKDLNRHLHRVVFHQNRCYNPKSQDFPNYGGRGIKMCDRWRNSFEAFLEDMGEPPPGMTDRTNR